jgi:hypothetical protein
MSTITAETLEPGVNYFCIYEAEIDPNTMPLLSQSDEVIPVAMITGKAQILQRDKEKRLVEVIDLETHQRHIVGWDKISDIVVAD